MIALEPRDAALVRAGLAIPAAGDAELQARFAAAGKAGTPQLWLDELTLMAVLFTGFPRALIAARILRRVQPVAAGEDGGDYDRWREWAERGETTCRAVYGDHYDKLRAHVAELHPSLDRWVIVDGYGRTMGRPGLDMIRRELCAVALILPQNAPRQLHSHLRGALNVGAPRELVEATLELAGADALIAPSQAADARRLWQDIAGSVGGSDRSRDRRPTSPAASVPSVRRSVES